MTSNAWLAPWPQNRLRNAAALAFLLALTIGYFWKLTLSGGYTWLENPDQALQVRPWLEFEAREIHAGRLPLWDPYHWGGQTLIGQVQPGIANPLNWLLLAMPLRDGHIPLRVLHWYWVLIHWVAAAFTYALCRDLGAGYGESIVGASIFAFAGFVGVSLTPQFLMSAIWGPVILLFFARVFRGERPLASSALCGACLGFAYLGGHHNIPIYTTVLLGCLWLWYLLTHKDRVRPVLVFLLIFPMVAGLQMLPAIEYGQLAIRWSGAPQPQHWKDAIPYSVHTEYSMDPRGIPGMLFPGLSLHANSFVGIVAVSLALIALGIGWRRVNVRLMGAVAVGGVLFALGSHTPVQHLAYLWIPMVEKARYPAFAVVLSQVGIAALAALGLASNPRPGDKSASRLWCLLPLALGLAIFATDGVLTVLKREPIGHSAWAIAGVGIALAGVLYWLRGAPAAVLALFFVELLTLPSGIQPLYQPGSFLNQIADQADLAQFFRSQPGWFRFAADENVVPYNFGDYHGIEEFSGYLASMTENVHRTVGHKETLQMFGVRYWVASKPSRPEQVEVFRSRSGARVFEDPGIGEPLWSVHGFDCGSSDKLRVVKRVPNAMTIDADLACAGRVVVGDPWYPGWRAWVDGRRARIQEVEGVLRSVPVNGGHHRIEFRYRPGSVYWGAGLTVLGLLITGLLCRYDRPLQAKVTPSLDATL